MLRGILLIVVAVAIGVILLRATDDSPFATDEVAAGDDADDDVVEDDDAQTETEGPGAVEGETEGDGGAPSTTEVAPGAGSSVPDTSPVTRPPAEVAVLVANGSGVAGAAARFAEVVGGAGYETAPPANVREDGGVEASVVYFTDGYEDDAAAVAGTLAPVPAVAPLPDPAPVDDLRGASVVLVVGPDLAGT